jgi:hypothetical protein
MFGKARQSLALSPVCRSHTLERAIASSTEHGVRPPPVVLGKYTWDQVEPRGQSVEPLFPSFRYRRARLFRTRVYTCRLRLAFG